MEHYLFRVLRSDSPAYLREVHHVRSAQALVQAGKSCSSSSYYEGCDVLLHTRQRTHLYVYEHVKD